ncbi:MAG: methylated-DNA--[protein]-cysteine S-methyltransferase [Methanoregula sp.]|nr:methylated-DNA--[protein]-cysteine S-methyltransferase [Methanoregula sp.]
MKAVFFYQTDIGKIGIVDNGDTITHLFFPGEEPPLDAVVRETGLLKEAGRQLQNYLVGRQKTFTLPLAPAGTEFMHRVFYQLRAIPYGETRTYREIAESAGNSKASRAVGRACHTNPIPIFIPCHRVIGSDGALTGFRAGLPTKALLLEREKQHGHL